MSPYDADRAIAGNGAQLVISMLDVEVRGKEMRWWLRADGYEEDSGEATLILNERRRATIDLLAELLRSAADLQRREALQSDLYLKLLVVVGHELFDLLFPSSEVRATLADQLNKLRDKDVDLLRIKLRFDGAEEEWLAGLPWEYACTPVGDRMFDPSGVFLASRAELILSRTLRIKGGRRVGGARTPVPVLLVSSSPLDEPEDDGERDADVPRHPPLTRVEPVLMVQKLSELDDAGLIKLHQLVEEPPEHPSSSYAWRVTRAAVRERVHAVDPVIVHFMGHGRSFGGRGQLAFARDDGTVDWVSDAVFAELVQESAQFQLAFLQACESALPDPYVSFSGIARRLAAAGLPAVVAMQYQVRSSTANAFAAAFYDALLTHRLPIDYAVEKGRQTIRDQHDSGEQQAFGLPVVYLNSDHALMDPDSGPRNLRRTALGRGDMPLPGICPRCRTEISLSAKVCRECGLRFACPECERRYASPLTDKWCEDGHRLQQEPYKSDAIRPAADVPAGQSTGPAIAALTALHGEGGV